MPLSDERQLLLLAPVYLAAFSAIGLSATTGTSIFAGVTLSFHAGTLTMMVALPRSTSLGTHTEPAKEGQQLQSSGANNAVLVFPLANRISAEAVSRSLKGILANVPLPSPGVPRLNPTGFS